MAKAQNSAETAEENKTTLQKTKSASEDRKFPVETLRNNCVKLFGCTSSTFDGAFLNQDTSRDYTVSEAMTIITRWLGKEIK